MKTEQQKMVDKWFADGGDYKFRFKYDLGSESLVFDIGGYKGQWASDLFARYCCRIIVFEPVNDFAKEISKRFIKNNKIDVRNYGLGGSFRKEIISVCDDGSSIFRDSNQKQEIEIVDVVDLISKENIDSIDLMKINIEGGEYELLERLIEAGLIDIVNNIQVQFHNINKDSSERMKYIQNCLKKTHELTYQYKFVWENWVKK